MNQTLKSRLIFGVALVATLALASAACGTKSDEGAGEGTIKTIVSGSVGDVSYERAGEKQAVTEGMQLEPADFVVTSEKSSVDLAVTGYGIVKIGANSRVQVLTLSQSSSGSSAELKVEQGNVASFINRQSAESRYSVVTPTAIAGVRGTSFMVAVDKSRSEPEVKVAVLDGSVGVELPGQDEIILEKNSQMVIQGFQRITKNMIRPLSKESLTEMKRLAVFHKSNVLEFNSLLEDVRSASPELQQLEGDASIETALDDRDARETDAVQRARRADISKELKRDTSGDPIKLEPDSSYE